MMLANLLFPLLVIGEPTVTTTTSFGSAEPSVGDHITITIDILGGGTSGAFVGASLRIVPTGLTLGTAQIAHAGMLSQLTTLSANSASSGSYSLPSITSDAHYVVFIDAQILAPSSSVQTKIASSTAIALTPIVTTNLLARIPPVSVTAAVQSLGATIGEKSQVSFTIAAPDIPFTYAGAHLQLSTEACTIKSVTLSDQVLVADAAGFALPSFDGKASLVVAASCQQTATGGSVNASVIGSDGQSLGTSTVIALSAKVPFIGLESLIERSVERVGASAHVVISVRPPEVPFTYAGTRVRLSVVGLAIGAASIDGTPLDVAGDGYLLPDMKGGSTTTIAIEAQIVDASASVEVDLHNAQGEPLSDTASASITSKRLQINAGCSASSDKSFWLMLGAVLLLLRRLRASH